jgi:hypothetical protein
MFRGTGDLVPGPTRRRASPKAVWIAIALLNLGWISSVAIWAFTASGEANDVVEQERF